MRKTIIKQDLNNWIESGQTPVTFIDNKRNSLSYTRSYSCIKKHAF